MNVYILLDRSGSMSSLWNEAIGAINAYVKKLDKKTKIFLSTFDNESYDVLRNTSVKEWKDIKDEESHPRGMTPLYDSCARIMNRAIEDNSDKTILVVMTDGFENCSKEHTREQIKAKIKDFEKKSWEVVFLGANFDKVDSVASDLGLAYNKFTNITTNNLRSYMTGSLADATMAYTTTGTAVNITDKDKMSATKASV